MKPTPSPSSHNGLALSVKAAAILLAALAIYYQELAILANEAIRGELMSHIPAIPVLFTYLVYRKRKMLRATVAFGPQTQRKRPFQTKDIAGVLVCLLAFLLYWYGSYTFNPLEYRIISIPIFVAGLILVIFNTETLKVLSFPVAFLLFLVPLPLEVIYSIGTVLSTTSSETATTILKNIGLSVTLERRYEIPVIVLAKQGNVPIDFYVDIACAGLDSLTGFTIFSVFAAYLTRGALWKKATILVAGFPLILGLNITRIVAIVLIGAQYGLEQAMQAFHLLGGWVLVFLGTLILLTVSEKALNIQLITPRKNNQACSHPNQSLGSEQRYCIECGRILTPNNISLSLKDLGKIIVLAVAVVLFVNLQVPVFALTEGPAEVEIHNLGGEQTITQILPEIPEYEARFIYRDRRFENLSKQDASLMYAYVPSNGSTAKVWLTLEIARTRSSLHRWEVCLITWPLTQGYQPRVTQLSLRDVQILSNPPLTARYFAFQDKKSNITQVVLYWFENSHFKTSLGLEQKHVKISLIAFTDKPEDVPKVEDSLLAFALAIVNYWQPIKTWTQIAQLISQNGATLMVATTTFLGVVLIYQALREREERKANLKIYKKLSLRQEKLILEAVHQAGKHVKPTSRNIASRYQKLAGEPIELGRVLQKLKEAKEAGLTKEDIISQDDEPTLVWKSQIRL